MRTLGAEGGGSVPNKAAKSVNMGERCCRLFIIVVPDIFLCRPISELARS